MLTLHDIGFTVEQHTILTDIDLDLGKNDILALVGPSGSGKSTLLRIIAGLERPTHGDVKVEDASIVNVPAHARNFGLMFQDYALFPHLNVADNVAFGMKMRGVGRGVRMQRVRDLLALVNLPGFERRDVTSLSGGEQQRVALARALAPKPRLLLLDEPLGALDAALRTRLLPELKAIIRQLQLATIYVTHDQQEAFQIADRIAVMNGGHIEQIDTPQRLYHHPRTAFVAAFLGFPNILPVTKISDGRAVTAVGDFAVEGQPNALLLPPDSLRLSRDGRGIPMQVEDVAFLGDSYRMQLRHESGLALEMTVDENATRPEGDTVAIEIDSDKVVELEQK